MEAVDGGIPLGITSDFLHQMQRTGLVIAGFGLGTIAFCGSLLTLGLVQRWGEIFPRWIPFLAGRAVPPFVAIVPASLVSVFVTEAGLAVLRGAFSFQVGELDWIALAPMLLWPIWGVALAGATLAYYYRRRGRCRRCGRS